MTREIANWFHEREGELFTESETPFDRGEVVDLTNDSVDPVQQVQVGGERYYGVIAYHEDNGFYHYTRYDDSAGKVEIGVCAKCVQEVEMVSEVARTLGDPMDVAREKMEQHYAEEHTEVPEDVETGATLLSGTTVAGNGAIHTGMDGSGSGVDADFVRGGEPVKEGVATGGSKSDAGAVQSQFASPSTEPRGVGLDSSDCIWHVDSGTNLIFEINQTGTVQSQFASPSTTPYGLGLDSSDCIWNADVGTDSIYEINQTGTVQSGFASPSTSPYGVGLDSGDCLWHTDYNADSIFEINQTGTVQSQFASPSTKPYGVGLDSSDCIWLAEGSAESIYEINQTGTVQSQFAFPGAGVQGLGLDSSNCIWNSDYSADSIYELTKFNKLSL